MKKVIVFGAVLLLMVGSVAVQAETIELKFAHFMSPKHIQHQKSFDPFTKKVAELTKGQVKIKIYPGGALGLHYPCLYDGPLSAHLGHGSAVFMRQCYPKHRGCL